MNVRYILIMLMSGILYTSTTVAQDKWDRVINLKGSWKFSIGDKALWGEKYFNDNKWEDIIVPSKWEDEGFNGYNGYAWYRRTFSGTEITNKEMGLHLLLGYIDDVDEVYFNGTKIGSSGSFPPRFHTAYNAFRNYYIPKDLIDFNGRNVIAVRVYDSEIEGGIVSGDIGIYTNRGDRGLTINLRGVWDFKLGGGRAGERYGTVTEASAATLSREGWTDILVPGQWEKQGFDDYDGSAWYRKTFTVPKEMTGEDLVLLLGKVDDSDKVFLNGKLVGYTEQRHDKVRMYHINSSQFKAGENTLIIFVEDTGGAGGIWEGPIGLMKQSEFTRYIRWK